MSYGPKRTSYDTGDNRCYPDIIGLQTHGVTLDGALFPTGTFPGKLVKTGTLVGKVTTTGLHGPYDNTATDGRQTAVGTLRNDQDLVREPRPHCAVVHGGTVDRRFLPANSGFDTAAKADLSAVAFIN